MWRCTDRCKTIFDSPVDKALHTKEECDKNASLQSAEDTKLFKAALEELSRQHSEESCAGCGKNDGGHTTRCAIGRALKRVKRSSRIRRSDDTKLLSELVALFGRRQKTGLQCIVCKQSEGRLGLQHSLGCVSAKIQARVSRFR